MKRDNKGYWKSRGKYNVRIYDNGKRTYLGSYDTEEEAMTIYHKACRDKLVRSIESYGHCIDDGVIYEKYYVVFDNGDIFSITGRKIIPVMNKHGYLRCHINDGEESIHTIVARCFIENRFNKPCVNHINGIKTDNRAENLEWCTYSENLRHAYNNQLRERPFGENNNMSKLTTKDIEYIRNNYTPRNPEYSMIALSKKFGVHANTIYNIIHHISWGITNER